MTKDYMSKILGGHGLPLKQKESTFAEELLKTFRGELMTAARAMPDYLGWAKTENKFYAATAVLTERGPEPLFTDRVEKEILQLYTPVGEFGEWRRAADMMLALRSQALVALMCSSFAAPLCKVLGIPGSTINVWSQETGTAKTTTIQVANAAWASPRALHQVADTLAAVTHLMGKRPNYPHFWDEVRSQQFLATFFQVSQGRGKRRMKADQTVPEQPTWDTSWCWPATGRSRGSWGPTSPSTSRRSLGCWSCRQSH